VTTLKGSYIYCSTDYEIQHLRNLKSEMLRNTLHGILAETQKHNLGINYLQ